jgi:hypothetical protein
LSHSLSFVLILFLWSCKCYWQPCLSVFHGSFLFTVQLFIFLKTKFLFLCSVFQLSHSVLVSYCCCNKLLQI